MKTMRGIRLGLATLAAAGLLWTGSALADDEGAACPGGNCMGGKGGCMREGKPDGTGRGMRKGMQDGMRGAAMQMRRDMMEAIPGAEEEMETHRDTMHALQQDARDLRYEIRKALRDAETDEAREEILEAHRGEVEAMVGKLVDERQRHQEAMLELKKENRDSVVESMTDRFLTAPGRGTGPRQDEMDGGPGQGMGGGHGGHGHGGHGHGGHGHGNKGGMME